jgi:hypothetical protein
MRRTSSAIGVVRQDVHFPPTYNFASRPSAIGNSRTRSALSRFSVFSFRILAVMSPSRVADASPCSESRHSDHSRTCSQSALFGSAPAICSASAVAFWKSAKRFAFATERAGSSPPASFCLNVMTKTSQRGKACCRSSRGTRRHSRLHRTAAMPLAKTLIAPRQLANAYKIQGIRRFVCAIYRR